MQPLKNVRTLILDSPEEGERRRRFPGGRYSIPFAVDIAIAKYTEHLPLARQVKQLKRYGLIVNSSTLWDQLFALYHHLVPTYEAISSYVLEAPVLGADETWWRLMGKGRTKSWWVWTVPREDAVSYHLHPCAEKIY